MPLFVNGQEVSSVIPFIKRQTGITLSSMLSIGSVNRADMTLGNVRACPIYLPAACTLDRIGLWVTGVGAAGALARVGLYNDTGNCYPNVLLQDGGEVDCTGTGVLLATISQEVQAGLYWVVMNQNDSAVDFQCLATNSFIQITTNQNLNNNGFSKAAAYGALPATFPSAAANDYLIPLAFHRISGWS